MRLYPLRPQLLRHCSACRERSDFAAFVLSFHHCHLLQLNGRHPVIPLGILDTVTDTTAYRLNIQSSIYSLLERLAGKLYTVMPIFEVFLKIWNEIETKPCRWLQILLLDPLLWRHFLRIFLRYYSKTFLLGIDFSMTKNEKYEPSMQ